MLNTAVPFESNTIHSHRYNYPTESPRRSLELPEQQPRSRRSSYSGEDEHSHILAEPIEGAPPVIVFFSFMDANSKQWALEYQVVQNLRRNVPQGTTISQYHAPMRFAWDFGEQLTHAWAVAESLHVDDKIIRPLFEAIHGRRVHDLEGIRTIFDECGVPPDMFLKEWGKQKVITKKKSMDDAVAHVDLNAVPGILVNGKYMVKLDSFGAEFNADGAVKLVKELLARD